MLQVECESCGAPYQIDERRIPPSGLKMRCPKCGHTFVVSLPGSTAAVSAPLQTVAARAPTRALDPPSPARAPPQAPAQVPSRSSFPSDFPAALGFLDEADLPVVSSDLPSSKGAGSPKMRERAFDNLELDLPVTAAELPTAKRAPPAPPPRSPARGGYDVDLPVRAASGGDSAALPEVAADLPNPSSSLPVVAAPGVPRATSVTGASARAFGEIDLPVVSESLPVPTALDRHLPISAPPPELHLAGAFGEIDLPREAAPSSVPPPLSAKSAAFVELQLDEAPKASTAMVPRSTQGGPAVTGMSFGEVDFGGAAGRATNDAAIGVESMPSAAAGLATEQALARPALGNGPPTATARGGLVPRERPASKRTKRSLLRPALIGAAFLAVLGGASLQLTSVGAFGYLVASDLLHAGDYALASSTAISDAHKVLGPDTYDAARAAVDATYAAHERMPRARRLTAFAALVDYGTTVRFGSDAARASRAKQLLAELPPEVSGPERDAAAAAQAAEAGDVDKARRMLAAASGHEADDPARLDTALLRGEVALALADPALALTAFKRATEFAPDARGHFGQARAYTLLGDAANTKKELEATLAASPQHPGALTLRARRRSVTNELQQALLDLATVLDGSARSKASPSELSQAYAARAWIELARGGTSEAREAFAQAVRLYPSNVDALNGEGRLLLADGRFAEALARFDTALKLAPSSPDAMANDADAKISLERLADAKQQLLAAREAFPKSLSVLLTLAKVERHLGNWDVADADLRVAVGAVDPAQPDAVLPSVALAELLASRGRLSDAQATLDEAKRKLPPSPALERAFGEVSELQGDYDAAIAHYRAAAERAPKDLGIRFRLAVALRRERKFDGAAAELERLAALDPDYPGLLLERGLLFEESGQVEKAIEKFKEALARAPDDPDLQLRVGSAYVVIGRPDDALPMLRKVLDKRPTSAEAHHYVGRAMLEKGGSSEVEALRYLHRAVELDPNRAEFHVYLAWAANDATPAQLELSRDEIERALALDKTNPEVYWQRGVLERMEGAIDDAIRDERHALELRPSRYEAHATLAECYEDRNDEAAAMGEWVKALGGQPSTPGSDGTLPHPYWRYRYGKLLFERGSQAAALAQLLPAALAAEKMEPRPGWLAPLEFMTAEGLRRGNRKADAVDHYRRFLDLAPVTSPDRGDAQAALARLTGER